MAKDRGMEKLGTDDFFAQIYDELQYLRDSAERIEERVNALAIHIAITDRNRGLEGELQDQKQEQTGIAGT